MLSGVCINSVSVCYYALLGFYLYQFRIHKCYGYNNGCYALTTYCEIHKN